MFIVRGGVFTDTTFKTLESKEERYGPFPDRDAAVQCWRARMGWMVDNCCHRLFIEPA
jgi:hypothetical protein